MTDETVHESACDDVSDAWLRLWTADGIIEVRPGNGGGFKPTGSQVVFLTAWNPGATPAQPVENDARHLLMLNLLDAKGHDHVRAAYIGANGSWAQPAAALTGVTPAEGARLAEAVGQTIVTVWDDDQLITTCSASGRRSATGWTSEILQSSPCPIHAPGEHHQEICVMPGGPFGSQAMAAAAQWSSRRASLLRAVGCDVCHGGRPVRRDGKPVEGTPIPLLVNQDPAPGNHGVWVEPHQYR